MDIVQTKTAEVLNFTLTSPTVLVGMFIGAMLTFVFSAFTMSAVQTAAQSIVVEVRRQFREIAGIMEGKSDPDYASCVALCTKGALHEMVAPALLAIVVPILTGLILGPTGVVGLLGGVSVTGFAMAVFMSNAGGAWDNAKKPPSWATLWAIRLRIPPVPPSIFSSSCAPPCPSYSPGSSWLST